VLALLAFRLTNGIGCMKTGNQMQAIENGIEDGSTSKTSVVKHLSVKIISAASADTKRKQSLTSDSDS